jgi:homoserine O-acetyltransferase/O-succinyltransferase
MGGMASIAEIGDLTLHHGGVLRRAELAYVTYGRLATERSNAVLLTHGYESSHLFAKPVTRPGGSGDGGWGGLVGPGRAIDTDRYFVISSNMLGSSYGSTGPRSLDPATGRPYGPSFPRITLGDIVAAQRRMLDRLGIAELVAVVGPSYGGFQAFTWGVEYPTFVRGIVAVTTGTSAKHAIDMDGLRGRFAAELAATTGHGEHAPASPDALVEAMISIRENTLRRYGFEAVLAERWPHLDAAARGAALHTVARAWAWSFDPYSMLVLGAAASEFDVTPQLARIRARVLFVLSSTDLLWPPSIAPGIMAALRAAGSDATYHEIDSPYGHMAPGIDTDKWSSVLAGFLSAL